MRCLAPTVAIGRQERRNVKLAVDDKGIKILPRADSLRRYLHWHEDVRPGRFRGFIQRNALRFLEIPFDVFLEALRELVVLDDRMPFPIVPAQRSNRR